MSWRLGFVTLLVPGIIIFIVAMGAIFLQQLRSGEATQRSVGIAAEAVLKSPSGELLGTATFRQGATGVLIMAEVTGLTPGGHAFVIHESGACTPDFGAAGDHFNPGETEHGFIHPAWKRGGSVGAHGGDLPNIYAASDGSARADFFTPALRWTAANSILYLTLMVPPLLSTNTLMLMEKRSPTRASAWLAG